MRLACQTQSAEKTAKLQHHRKNSSPFVKKWRVRNLHEGLSATRNTRAVRFQGDPLAAARGTDLAEDWRLTCRTRPELHSRLSKDQYRER